MQIVTLSVVAFLSFISFASPFCHNQIPVQDVVLTDSSDKVVINVYIFVEPGVYRIKNYISLLYLQHVPARNSDTVKLKPLNTNGSQDWRFLAYYGSYGINLNGTDRYLMSTDKARRCPIVGPKSDGISNSGEHWDTLDFKYWGPTLVPGVELYNAGVGYYKYTQCLHNLASDAHPEPGPFFGIPDFLPCLNHTWLLERIG